MPIIIGYATLFMLSSFCSAVLGGPIQLFETMKRGGAGLLANVVKPTRLRRQTPPRQQPRPRSL